LGGSATGRLRLRLHLLLGTLGLLLGKALLLVLLWLLLHLRWLPSPWAHADVFVEVAYHDLQELAQVPSLAGLSGVPRPQAWALVKKSPRPRHKLQVGVVHVPVSLQSRVLGAPFVRDEHQLGGALGEPLGKTYAATQLPAPAGPCIRTLVSPHLGWGDVKGKHKVIA